jgi:hypothetical protein
MTVSVQADLPPAQKPPLRIRGYLLPLVRAPAFASHSTLN